MSRYGTVTSSLEQLNSALLSGQSIHPADFLPPSQDGEQGAAYAELIAQAIRTRSTLGERPWISDYIDDRLASHRDDICRVMTRMVFSGRAELAGRLGVQRFGDYVATELIGFGGFGSVFKGHHVSNRAETVAIKLAHRGSKAAARSLHNEITCLGKIGQVEGVPKLLASDSNALGVPFLVMNYIAGETLNAWRRRVNPPFKTRLVVCRRLLAIYEQLHKIGRFNHGDVSPSNILISGEGSRPHVTVTDFGSAVVKAERNPLRCVTLRYAAPELLSGKVREPSIATDLWGLGVTICELFDAYPFRDSDERTVSMTSTEWAGHISGTSQVPLPIELGTQFTHDLRCCLDPDFVSRSIDVTAHQLLESVPRTLVFGPKPSVDEVVEKAASYGTRTPYRNIVVAGVVALFIASGLAIYAQNRSPAPGNFAVPTTTHTTQPSDPWPPPPLPSGQEELDLGKVKALAKAAVDDPDLDSTLVTLDELMSIVSKYVDKPSSPYAEQWAESRRNGLNHLGLAYREKGRPNDAEAKFNELLALVPKPCHWRAIAFSELGKTAESRLESSKGSSWQKAKDAAIQCYAAAEQVFNAPEVRETENAAAAQQSLARVRGLHP